MVQQLSGQLDRALALRLEGWKSELANLRPDSTAEEVGRILFRYWGSHQRPDAFLDLHTSVFNQQRLSAAAHAILALGCTHMVWFRSYSIREIHTDLSYSQERDPTAWLSWIAQCTMLCRRRTSESIAGRTETHNEACRGRSTFQLPGALLMATAASRTGILSC